MILYLEKKAKSYDLTQKILQKFQKSSIIEIENYKNVFDKTDGTINGEKSIILAKLESSAVLEAPPWYGHSRHSYFFKTSFGCVFDCDYCFLKGAFRTEHMVYFVNYDDIKHQIEEKIQQLSLQEIQSDIWFYSSDYSDILWMNMLSDFVQEFIPFFETFDGAHMEIRTKSSNILSLKNLNFIPKNTEIAFSLNPQILIDHYEHKTSSLSARISAIQELKQLWFRVWIRLLPLLPVKNFREIYGNFFEYLRENINFCEIDSVFASGLLYTKQDYKVMLKKYPHLDILYYLELGDDDFYREAREVRDWFYTEIKKLDQRCLLCLEN